MLLGPEPLTTKDEASDDIQQNFENSTLIDMFLIFKQYLELATY